MLRLVFFALLVAAPVAAQDAGQMTGNQLLELCSTAEAPTEAARLSFRAGVCTGIVHGAIDAWAIAAAVHEANSKARAARYFCMPKSATYGQAQGIVLNHLKNHPAERHKPAAEIVITALAVAWPCPVR